MQHVDPETLALLALGEQAVASDADRAHLASCPVCRAEVDELAMVAATARASDDELVRPPAEVWDRVRAQILAEDEAPEPLADPAPDADVVQFAPRRRPSVAWLAAAAGVALIAGVAGGAWWERARTPEPAPTPAPVALARADLEALPDWEGSTGTAIVQETQDGAREIVVQVDEPDGVTDAYQEVWLLAEDLSGMVSLGVLEGPDGTFPVPAGIDLDRFAVVDVSAEPFDGDPTHSGDSIVRGGLTEA